MHLFHLLRDDLELLHRLMDAWRIASLGQFQAFLASSAASGAITEATERRQLQRRCEAARAWVALWRQGRGRPLDRAALEQSGAVSGTFIDRAADLAGALGGDAAAFLQALREGRLSRFHASKIDKLDRWLADAGYTDDRPRLNAAERARKTLQEAAPANQAEADDIGHLLAGLEGAGG